MIHAVRHRALLSASLLLFGLSLGGCSPTSATSAQDNTSHAGESQPAVSPARNTPSEQTQQAETPDVIVVGAGISGLSAALELGRGGAKVTVIDMSSVFGGHAVMSQGSVSIVATPTQQQAGIEDSPDLAYGDFHRWGEDPNSEWVRYYVDHSRSDIYDWLHELGVRFTRVVRSFGNSVAREHQPLGRGIGLVTPIYRACLESGNVEFLWNNKAEQLLIENGRVVGVQSRNMRSGDLLELKGKAVILATGGFQSNLDMVREFWPAEFRFPDRVLAGSGRNSIGLGHKMAQAVGGELTRMEDQWNYFTGLPDPRYPGTDRGLNATNLFGILVNSEGQRFVNFHGWAKVVMPVLLRQKEATCWCIFDEVGKPFFSVSGSDWGDFAKVEKLIFQNSELMQQADTLEELAVKAGLPIENVVKTVARYNQLVEHGVDTDFRRFGPGIPEFAPNVNSKIATPPFYAMQTFPLTRKSMGGVAIDLECRVLDKQQQPIPGLYAVGELAGLAGVNGRAALEGTFLGPCIVTGRVSARSLLKRLKITAPLETQDESHCNDCHDMTELLSEAEPGFWHFEKVHRTILEREIDCRQCHSELTPYREDSHHINQQTLAASCVVCHVARE